MCEGDKRTMRLIKKGNNYYQEHYLTQFEIKELQQLLKSINKIEPLPIKKGIRWLGTDPETVSKKFSLLLHIVAQKHRLTTEIIQSKKKCRITTLARADFARIAFNKIIKNKGMIAKFLGRGGKNISMTTAFDYWTDKPVTRLTKEIGEIFYAD